MKKSLIACLVFLLLSSVVITLSFGVVAAEDGVVQHDFNNPASGYTDFVHPWVNWDLTRGDLKVSYSLDMSNFTPANGNSDVSEVGIIDHKSSAGQIGWMVTLGTFAHCKVDADIAPIKVGDLLTTSPTRGHAQKVLDPSQASGAIVGKALGSLETGKGKIPVLVTLH